MLSIRMISVDFIVDNDLSLFIPKDWHHYLSGIIRIRSQVDLVKVIAMQFRVSNDTVRLFKDLPTFHSVKVP